MCGFFLPWSLAFLLPLLPSFLPNHDEQGVTRVVAAEKNDEKCVLSSYFGLFYCDFIL